jgi:hypothetical protein
MPNLARLRVELIGAAVVGPSVMTLYQDAANTGLPAATVTWLNAIKANFPPSLSFVVPGGGDILGEADGALIGSWSDGGGATVVGTGTGGFAIGVGARVRWTTAGITRGRRVRGTTFLVPLMSGSYETDGRIRAATVTALQTPTNAFLTTMGSNLLIWSRPKGADAGDSHPVTAASIPNLPSTLRSRRT